MADIASLGLAVDSTPVTKATAALDQFAAAAAPAANAARTFQTANDNISGTMNSAAAAANKAGASFNVAASGTASFAGAARPATAALAELQKALDQAVSDQNIFAQAQENGTTNIKESEESMRGQRLVLRALASDLTIFGGELGGVAGEVGQLYIENSHLIGGFGGLKNAIVSLITPQNLLIGGLTILAVGTYAAVKAIIAQEKEFDNLAQRANTTLQSLHSLESAASFKGIETSDFLKGMEQFADLSNEATHNMGTLAELFRANGVAAGTVDQNVLHLADLIRNAANEADKYRLIQAAGLPATREWVDFLSQGAEGIRKAREEAAAFGDEAAQELVNRAREFDEAWGTAWKNFSNASKAALLDTLAAFDRIKEFSGTSGGKLLYSYLTGGLAGAVGTALGGAIATQTGIAAQQSANTRVGGAFDSLNGNYNNASLAAGLAKLTGSGAAGTTKLPADLTKQLSDVQLYVGALGELATVDQVVAAKQAALDLLWQQSGVDVGAARQRILDYTRAQALGLTQIDASTNALNVQAAAFGMTAGQAAAFTAVQTRINEANLRGAPLTNEQVEALKQHAAALGAATTQMEGMHFAQSTLSNSMQTFRNDLEQGASAWTAFKDAGKAALDAIENQLMEMAAKQLVSNVLGPILGTAAKIGFAVLGFHTGGVVGADSPMTRTVDAGVFAGAPRFHTGGVAADEVPIIAKAGEAILTPAQMRMLAPVNSGGGGTTTVSITNHYDFSGGDPGTEARLRAYVDATAKQTVSAAVAAVSQTNAKAPAYLRNVR